MKIRTLAEWFDDLPEDVKDALSELVYERDLNNFEARINDFIAESVRFSNKEQENASERFKMPDSVLYSFKYRKNLDIPINEIKKPNNNKKNKSTPISNDEIKKIRKKLDCGFDILPF